jgi:DNA-binding transcriptional MocR family regulator
VEIGIGEGHLAGSERLPTVRELASRLGTSPATVNLAYRILRERGLIVTAGRRGTRVAPRPPVLGAESLSPRPPAVPGLRDLASGLPDPALLPSIGDALRRVDLDATLSLSETDRTDPRLIELAAQGFAADGIAAAHLAVTSAAFDAIERVLGAYARPGDRVLVEDPTFGAFRDLITALGLVCVPVPIDDEGPLPNAFAAALERGVTAALLTPRAQNPTGAARSGSRAQELSHALARHPDVLLIEDDHAGAVAGAPMHGLAGPNRWVVIRATSKMLHPDLRLAVVAGDAVTIARVQGRQALGPRWVSPILQATVVELLRDPGATALMQRACATYTRRRAALLDALHAHGIEAHGRSGVNVWVPVREETHTVAALESAGWLVAPGERFRFAAAPGIRVTVAALAEGEAGDVAAVIAGAQRDAGARGRY